MKNDDIKITHKELLTFSNLTNLAWEFAELRVGADEDGFDPGEEEEVDYKSLDDLLTPEEFERIIRVENEEDDIYEEKRKYICVCQDKIT